MNIRHLITIVESWRERDAGDVAIVRDMLSRADPETIRDWALRDGYEPSDLAENLLDVFSDWLDQEHAIRVYHGMVEFYRLDFHDDSRRLVGANPVLLYHFTSSARIPSIRKFGLVADRRSVNRTQTAGVYLTTETSGPAVVGYVRGALRNSRGKAYGVRISVRTYLSELAPDPDDADITSGATQFVTDHVPPEQIVSIDRA